MAASVEVATELSPWAIQLLVSFTKTIPLLLPLINLSLVFMQQCTSGLLAAAASVLHVFSNPVDALWSILCRQEFVRRCNVFAARNAPDVARELAAILSTYDQWLEDPQPHVLRSLAARRRLLSLDRPNHVAVMTEEEKLLIRGAALRLRCCHVDGLLSARVSVASFIISLFAVACRVLRSDDGDVQVEAERVLSFIAMFTHLIFAVNCNGSVGVFMYQEEAARIIFELCAALESVNVPACGYLNLLPLPAPGTSGHDSLAVCTNAAAFSKVHAALGNAAGTISTLRPRKFTIAVDDHDGRAGSSLVAMAICAISVSICGAVAIHLSVLNTRTVVEMLPLAACVTIWILNWLTTMCLSYAFARRSIGIRMYSYIVTGCDLVCAALIVIGFGWSFTAWAAGIHIPVPLTSITIVAWYLIMCAVFVGMVILVSWASYNGENARLVYVRSLDEALADSTAISSSLVQRPGIRYAATL